MIGKAYVSTFPYYDRITRSNRFKSRPVLIIGKSDSSDYVVLPISRVTRRENLDSQYDYELKPECFPLMNLTQTSYVRTHKQTIAHDGVLTKCITDFKKNYPEAYLNIIKNVEKFNKNIVTNALD